MVSSNIIDSWTFSFIDSPTTFIYDEDVISDYFGSIGDDDTALNSEDDFDLTTIISTLQ